MNHSQFPKIVPPATFLFSPSKTSECIWSPQTQPTQLPLLPAISPPAAIEPKLPLGTFGFQGPDLHVARRLRCSHRAGPRREAGPGRRIYSAEADGRARRRRSSEGRSEGAELQVA